jgi:hypothetical protein
LRNFGRELLVLSFACCFNAASLQAISITTRIETPPSARMPSTDQQFPAKIAQRIDIKRI